MESAWLDALVASGLAPSAAATDLAPLVTVDDLPHIAAAAEGSGNPVVPLVGLLRSRAPQPAATWLHRGLTSQDVLDTALMLSLRDALERLIGELRAQVTALARLAAQHAHTPMVGRTLTQHAVSTTFGAVTAGWLDGLVDAADLVLDARSLLPVQLGGAVGTLSAVTELADLRGHEDPQGTSADLVASTAAALGLRELRPWHTSRATATRTSDALVTCTSRRGPPEARSPIGTVPPQGVTTASRVLHVRAEGAGVVCHVRTNEATGSPGTSPRSDRHLTSRVTEPRSPSPLLPLTSN